MVSTDPRDGLPAEDEAAVAGVHPDPAAGYVAGDEPQSAQDQEVFDGVDESQAAGGEPLWEDGPELEDDAEQGIIFFTVDDPRVYGYVRPEPPMGLSPEAKVRRQRAQELAEALADPPYRLEGGGHDWVHAAMEVPAGFAPMQRVLQEAGEVAETAILVPGETWVATGYETDSGLVFRVHGPVWSVVFTTMGPNGGVFVCTEEVPDVPLRLKLDARGEAEGDDMIIDVLNQLQRISLGGDKSTFNPNMARQG